MRRSGPALLTLFAGLAAVTSAAHAQDDLARCAAIEEADARLACFDAATRRTGRSPAAPAPAAAPAAVPTDPAAVATPPAAATPAAASAGTAGSGDDFGRPAKPKQDVPERISAVITSVEPHTHPGRWVVTLDNGQVWEQRETTAATKRPRPGDLVTIEEASFGSYLMMAPGRGASRVKRIR